MSIHRIVFAGTVGAGKTTAIRALSDVEPVSTEVASEEARAAGKPTTTVAFDYGYIALDDGSLVALYGAPGQTRFDFMWEVLARGAMGVIVLANNAQPDAVERTAEFVDVFSTRYGVDNAVVGVGRTESHAKPGLQAYIAALPPRRGRTPVLAVDVRRREDVLLLVDVLLERYVGAEDA